jgi:hypothetical protein
MTQTSTTCIWYGYPYAMPAEVLSDEPTHDEDTSNLRADASQDGTCYVRILHPLEHDIYLARVAASPNFDPNREGHTVVLTQAQLSQVCPWNPYAEVA